MNVNAIDSDEISNENRILFWLRLYEWSLSESALLFANLNPEDVLWSDDNKVKIIGCINLNGERHGTQVEDFWNYDTNDIYCIKYTNNYLDYIRILGHGRQLSDNPSIWIDLAIEKKLHISWLELAIESGLYRNKNTTITNNSTNLFDKNSEKYPPELDLAIQAWQAVSSCEGKGKPKSRIKAWLETNTNVSNEAKERISIVANWEKSGGATKLD